MLYQLSLIFLLLAARATTADSHEVIYTDSIDQQKHHDVERLIVSNSSAKVNLRGPTPVTSSGLTSATLSSPTSVPVVCATVNEDSDATISCPSGTRVGNINFASYGTPSGSCGGFSKDRSCDSYRSKSAVENLCLNQATCTVPANNFVFSDPCRGTFKRLYIQATCTPPPYTVCASAAENSVARINCPSGTVMRTINFASYGTPTGSCGAFSNGWCDSSNSIDVVRYACISKASCSVSAKNSVFGDPCGGTPKSLYIQATCEI